MSETAKESEGLPGIYLDIDARIHEGPAGTGLEEALKAELDGIVEAFKSWRLGQFIIPEEDRHWNSSFNVWMCLKLENMLRYNTDGPQPQLTIGQSGAYGRLVRFEKYRNNFALYEKTWLESGAKLPISYVGRHFVYSNYSHDLPKWDTDLEQLFIGAPEAGYDELGSGLVISSNQTAKTLLEGGDLKFVMPSDPAVVH
jgi:hypothetical protein